MSRPQLSGSVGIAADEARSIQEDLDDLERSLESIRGGVGGVMQELEDAISAPEEPVDVYEDLTDLVAELRQARYEIGEVVANLRRLFDLVSLIESTLHRPDNRRLLEHQRSNNSRYLLPDR